MGDKGDTRTAEVARIAARQHGVVTMAQLEAVGVTRRVASKWTQAGRLHRLHRGVYAVGHRGITVEGRWLAAVLACGDGAVLSHRSAAGLWGLLRPVAAPVHVSVPTAAGVRQRPGIRVHRCASLQPAALGTRNRIRVTSVPRTLVDLRATADAGELHRATRQAEVLGLLVAEDATDARTNGELERKFLTLCRRAGFPEPEVNVLVAGHLVDFFWPAHCLVIETDGYRFHRGATAFEDDHARELDLLTAGCALRRFTYKQVTGRPSAVVAALAEALQSSRSVASSSSPP
jgi:very-short-patch-repair endonuclease